MRATDTNRFAAAFDSGVSRTYIGAPFLNSKETRLAGAHFPPAGKSDHRAPRVVRGTDHVHGHGVRGSGESENSFGSAYAGRRRAVRHLSVGRAGHALDGIVGQLSDRAGAGNVAERVFHIFRRDSARSALADSARRGISFRHFISAADADQ